MSTITVKTNYAVQRLAPDNDWDILRNTITPHEGRARRLMRWQRSLQTRFHFRVVKLETQTTVIPVDDE
jgi:hypothetical protein